MNYKTKLNRIKAFAFDVDGVLTDGSIISTTEGDLLRTFDSKDGLGMRLALMLGYPIGIITGGNSPSIENRFKLYKINDIYMGSHNKLPDFLHFCKKYELKPEEVAYIGDDLPDIPVLQSCGLAVCPSDAAVEVKEICDYISSYKGGKGCARELIEQVLKIAGKWEFDVNTYQNSYNPDGSFK